jgi:diguanylate cyclase (GGDEF)-like protein
MFGSSPWSLYFSPLIAPAGQVPSVLLNIVEAQNSGQTEIWLRRQQEQVDEQVMLRTAALEESNRQLRREIEKLLKSDVEANASEPFFWQNFLNLPDPILIWGKDDEGEIRLVFANQAAANLSNSQVDDMTGLLLEDFYVNSMQFTGLVETAFSAGKSRQEEFSFVSHVTQDQKWVTCDCIRLSELFVLNILRDISQQKNRQQMDETARNQIELLRQAMTAFTSVLNMEQVLKNVLEYLQKLIPYDRVILYMLDGSKLHVQAAGGFSPANDPLDLEITARNPQFEAINRNRTPLFLPNALEYRPFESLGPLNCGQSWLGVPLLGHGQVLGYLSIYSDTPALYGSEHTRLAEIFANEASIAIENARLFEQVQLLAVTDELTGFYNRRYFYELVEMELARARRYHHATSLILMDIDYFKAVNDRFGHTTGDLVLKELCGQIRRAVRESDILGRHGGEEFVLLLPETPRDKAIEAAERLRALVESHPIRSGENEINITISLGVATVSEACNTADGLFGCADTAMYQAKQAGRNKVSAGEG